MYILGISAYYHDSAACLVKDGEIIAAVQEERFTRKKHDDSAPINAIRSCLEIGGIRMDDVDLFAFYDKPLLKFERLLESYYEHAPKGLGSFIKAMPVWLKEKLFLKRELYKLLKKEAIDPGKVKKTPILFPEHHLSHAASAFYPSPFEEAALLTLDGVGEYSTTTLGIGKGNKIEQLSTIDFPHSLGLLYSAFTYYTGFRVNSGEYKLMGLSPYGKPKYADKIKEHLIDIKDDGSFNLNMPYFNYEVGSKMTNDKFHDLFGRGPRKPESDPEQLDMDLAASVQQVVEEAVMKIGQHLHDQTGMKNLCMAGGVALNCVANGKLLTDGPYDNIWIQPAAGDAGGAVGAALAAWYIHEENERSVVGSDFMKSSLLGPEYGKKDLDELFQTTNAVAEQEINVAAKTAELISNGKIIGWYQGRMEFGPRALGNRSILADPRDGEMQKKLNLSIKYRESFRPFAPIVKAERVSDFFEFQDQSPYMLMVAPVKKDRQLNRDLQLSGLDRLHQPLSDIPAVTHVDYSARIQTVDSKNQKLYDLLDEFEKITGFPVLINTSFNVRGEPIVNTPMEAYSCFMNTEMDVMVIGDHIFYKEQQPKWEKQTEFALD